MAVRNLLILVGLCLLSNIELSAALPLSGRIFGGQTAEPGQFPFIVSIQEHIEELDFHGHYCGGSILNSQWVVTAGHCIMLEPKLENYQIIAGTPLLDTGGFRYNVSKLILHPEFDISTVSNDIGLIKIIGEFTFTDAVASIEIGEVLGNESSTALGWGSTSDETNPNELHFLQVTVLSVEDCARLAEGAFWSDVLKPGPAQVCDLSPEGKGVCHGDSGSPLVYNNTLVGIASYLLDLRCASQFPEVFTRASYYKKWIQDTIEANS